MDDKIGEDFIQMRKQCLRILLRNGYVFYYLEGKCPTNSTTDFNNRSKIIHLADQFSLGGYLGLAEDILHMFIDGPFRDKEFLCNFPVF